MNIELENEGKRFFFMTEDFTRVMNISQQSLPSPAQAKRIIYRYAKVVYLLISSSMSLTPAAEGSSTLAVQERQ